MNIDLLETAKSCAAVIGPFLGGGGVWAYMASRSRANRTSIVTNTADLSAVLTQQTRLLLAESAKDRRDLKRVVSRQGLKLNAIVREVAECNGRHAECETRVSGLQDQITRIMADNPPAGAYEIKDR